MKFCKSLRQFQEERESISSAAYLDYKQLKKVIKALVSQPKEKAISIFRRCLIEELHKINAHYNRSLQVFQERFLTLKRITPSLACLFDESKDGSQGATVQEWSAFALDLDALRAYVNMNTTGFRKIAKKFDKNVGTLIQRHVVADLARQSFYTSTGLSKLIVHTKAAVACLKAADDPPLISDYECPVCRELLQEPVPLSCSHVLCVGCLKRSTDLEQTRCPVCRKEHQHNIEKDEEDQLVVDSVFQRFVRRFFHKEIRACTSPMLKTEGQGHVFPDTVLKKSFQTDNMDEGIQFFLPPHLSGSVETIGHAREELDISMDWRLSSPKMSGLNFVEDSSLGLFASEFGTAFPKKDISEVDLTSLPPLFLSEPFSLVEEPPMPMPLLSLNSPVRPSSLLDVPDCTPTPAPSPVTSPTNSQVDGLTFIPSVQSPLIPASSIAQVQAAAMNIAMRSLVLPSPSAATVSPPFAPTPVTTPTSTPQPQPAFDMGLSVARALRSPVPLAPLQPLNVAVCPIPSPDVSPPSTLPPLAAVVSPIESKVLENPDSACKRTRRGKGVNGMKAANDVAPKFKRSHPRFRPACSNCHRSKVCCSGETPCNRCVRQGRADLCAPRSHRKKGRPRVTEDDE